MPLPPSSNNACLKKREHVQMSRKDGVKLLEVFFDPCQRCIGTANAVALTNANDRFQTGNPHPVECVRYFG